MKPPLGASLRAVWAVVPIRGLATAKTRLGPELDPGTRRMLVEAMLRRTLIATRDARSLAGTVVVTKDPGVAGLAHDHRAVGLVERLPGLNEAIQAAGSVAIARRATAMLVLPADLPAVSAAAIDAFVAAAAAALEPTAAAGLVALVTDRHGRGTNALLVSPPAVVAPAFGQESRAAHREAAAAAGARYVELDGPLALDVDTPADLLVAAAALAPGER
ncbi:MAG TPA: 2-phospho-L-lactate guanylyltransferase [Candidatus Limnocylindrales bacterium]